jgi:glycosyltransferase involved in cell wall biosynthesis
MTDPALRVVVTASSLDLDGTAEGSCSVKYVQLLARLGHHVTVVNGANNLRESPAPWLPGVEIVDLAGPVEREPERGALGRRMGAARAHLSGFGPLDRQRRRRWLRTLPEVVDRVRPDVVVTRAAGLDATPHLAMVDLRLGIPWVAHLHDPWPLSAFPDPYRRREGLLSLRQEAAARRILRTADVVTFPSARHRDWQLTRSGLAEAGPGGGRRALVVPHLGVEGGLVVDLDDPWAPGGSAAAWTPPDPDGDDPLRLIHCGSLFRQRDPRPLLEALAAVVADAPPGRPPLHLTLVGWLDPKLVAAPGWAALVDPLVAAGALDVRPGNLRYVDSVHALEASDVLLTYVVGSPESPQFPAKLADHFSLGRPMLVIAPAASTPADLVGRSAPAFVDRDRPGAIEAALRALVERRQAGSLAELAPTATQRRSVAIDAVGAAVQSSLARAQRHRQGLDDQGSVTSGNAPSA